MPLCTVTPHALSPLRACSSYSTASWANVPPPPPYSSGTDNASSPTSPALVHTSRSTRFCSAHRCWCGVSSFRQNVLARSRTSSSSSVIHGLRRICSGTGTPTDKKHYSRKVSSGWNVRSSRPPVKESDDHVGTQTSHPGRTQRSDTHRLARRHHRVPGGTRLCTDVDAGDLRPSRRVQGRGSTSFRGQGRADGLRGGPPDDEAGRPQHAARGTTGVRTGP